MVSVLQIGCEQLPELESCVAEMCLDGAFETFQKRCYGFDRHFMKKASAIGHPPVKPTFQSHRRVL